MRFFNLLRFDLEYGILRKWSKYLFFCLLILLACLEFLATLRNSELSGYSCGDFLLYLYGGMREYIPVPGEPFQIPYLWLINHSLTLFFSLQYMYEDLTGFGQYAICRGGSRASWWFSNCVWNVCFVGLFYLLAWAVIFLFARCNGASANLKISDFMPQIMNFGGKQILTSHWNITLQLTLLPVLTTAAISLLQMALCLVIKPVLSYVCSAVLLIASAYTLSPFLLGNYAMALRSDEIVANGVSGVVGVFALTLTIIFSIVSGYMVFRNYSILNSKE